jgi:hypothetical protein
LFYGGHKIKNSIRVFGACLLFVWVKPHYILCRNLKQSKIGGGIKNHPKVVLMFLGGPERDSLGIENA